MNNIDAETEHQADLATTLLKRMLDPLGLKIMRKPGTGAGRFLIGMELSSKSPEYEHVWFHSSKNDEYFDKSHEWCDNIEFEIHPEFETIMEPENEKYVHLTLLQYLGFYDYDSIVAKDKAGNHHMLLKFGKFSTLPELAINLDLKIGQSNEDTELLKVIETALEKHQSKVEALDEILKFEREERGLIGFHASPAIEVMTGKEEFDKEKYASDVITALLARARGDWEKVSDEELERM